jgi:menaquinone-dependent protoporphyrinogen oxidase
MANEAQSVLVAYGTRNGSTKGIADLIGNALRDEGLAVTVRPAGDVRDLDGYDAVVLGGALYMGRWHHDARRFVHRHASALAHMPVWLFSSGPLDGSADERDIPPVSQAAGAAGRLRARGHVTFGGRLADGAEGFVAKAMIRNGKGGDFRNADRIAAWGRTIAAEIRTLDAGRREDVSS